MINISKYHLYITVLILPVLLTTTLNGQVITAKAYIESNNALLGDPLVMHLRIEKPDTLQVSLPDPEGIFPESIEITGEPVADTSREGDRQIIDYRYTIAAFDTGIIEIPAVKVAFKTDSWDTISTMPVLLEIVSLPLDSDIKDIKENYKAPVTFAGLAPYIALIAGLIALIIIALRYYKRRLSEMPVREEVYSQDPPGVIAVNALMSLQKEEPWKHNRIKQYYVRLTEILRVYIEQEFGIAALERTSDEILTSLRRTECDPAVIRLLDKILQVADLVKFAKLIPDETENSGQITKAVEFVKNSHKLPVSPDNENSVSPLKIKIKDAETI